jgi:hypothetical protein
MGSNFLFMNFDFERKVSFQFLPFKFFCPCGQSEPAPPCQHWHEDSLISVAVCLQVPDFRILVTWAYILPVQSRQLCQRSLSYYQTGVSISLLFTCCVPWFRLSLFIKCLRVFANFSRGSQRKALRSPSLDFLS